MEHLASHEQRASGLTWTSGSSRVNGIDLAWEQAGPTGGSPLLLVMGLGRQLIHWPAPFCEALAAHGFHLTRFDNRDAGLSASGDRGVPCNIVKDSLRKRFGLPVRANYTLHDMAADTVGLMDALALRGAHLVGVSMGGMIAQLVAGKHPERVLSLTSIMSSSNHPWLPSPSLDVLRVLLDPLPESASREEAVDRGVLVSKLIGSPDYRDPDSVIRAMSERAVDRAFRPDGVTRQSHAITATGSIERWVRCIVAPTQVIHGRADKLVRPAGGKRTAKLVRHSQLELIDGMGHDLPAALAPRLAGLIAANAAQAPTSPSA